MLITTHFYPYVVIPIDYVILVRCCSHSHVLDYLMLRCRVYVTDLTLLTYDGTIVLLRFPTTRFYVDSTLPILRWCCLRFCCRLIVPGYLPVTARCRLHLPLRYHDASTFFVVPLRYYTHFVLTTVRLRLLPATHHTPRHTTTTSHAFTLRTSTRIVVDPRTPHSRAFYAFTFTLPLRTFTHIYHA